MPFFLQFPILPLALFTITTLAATLPSNAGMISQTDTSLTETELNATGPRETVCSRRIPGQKDSPGFSMCAHALRGLPSSATVGTFSAFTKDAAFKVPDYARHRNGEVLAEMSDPGRQTQSSWIEIGLVAMELNAACQKVQLLGSGLPLRVR